LFAAVSARSSDAFITVAATSAAFRIGRMVGGIVGAPTSRHRAPGRAGILAYGDLRRRRAGSDCAPGGDPQRSSASVAAIYSAVAICAENRRVIPSLAGACRSPAGFWTALSCALSLSIGVGDISPRCTPSPPGSLHGRPRLFISHGTTTGPCRSPGAADD
jgi:hypothetical protein